MCTTNQEDIEYDELGEILRPHLNGRRLFLSACEMVHEDLAREIIPDSGCFSVIGPNEAIRFTDAAILWASLYHLMFSHSRNGMQHAQLLKVLQNTTKLFQVQMSYFSRSKIQPEGFTRDFLCK
jgi:hypothetical protein